jgi:proteasome accessory factor B
MDRLERLLDLVHVLQTAPGPVSLAALRDSFSDYAEGNDEAIRRKFERDKAELARIGIVLRYVTDDDEAGYLLDAEASYLPSVKLSDADLALLAGAGRAALTNRAFPYPRALRLALAKVGVGEPRGLPGVLARFPSSELGDGSPLVTTLVDALTRRKRLTITHRRPDGARSERTVDAYGVFCREGAFYLVGRDHERDDVRLFRASRIERATPNPKRPGEPDYELPEGFDLRRFARLPRHRFEVHDEVIARIWVDPVVAFMMEPTWGAPDERSIFTVPTTHVEAIVDRALVLGARAELLEPESARATVAAALRAVLEAHGAV